MRKTKGSGRNEDGAYVEGSDGSENDQQMVNAEYLIESTVIGLGSKIDQAAQVWTALPDNDCPGYCLQLFTPHVSNCKRLA